jgi:hypothetical protein
MLVEAAFASLVFLAWRKVRGRKGMTQERKDIYLDALEHMVNPADLRTLADGYKKEGLPIEASMLRKRADLREMPREKWENFRAICEHAIQKPDTNPQALDEMAQAFDAMTATGTAIKLRKRAAERRLEILAFAEQEEAKKREAAAKADEESKKDTEAPPTPQNSGVPIDPDKTLNPEESGAHVPPIDPTTASAGAENARSDAP